jgi:hypothetical protein
LGIKIRTIAGGWVPTAWSGSWVFRGRRFDQSPLESADPFASSTVAGAIKPRQFSLDHSRKDRMWRTIAPHPQHAKLERWI